MPPTPLLPGQVRTTVGCLASAFAASSSASALALVPAHLARETDQPDLYTSVQSHHLPRTVARRAEEQRPAKRPTPEPLDAERAAAAATRHAARPRLRGSHIIQESLEKRSHDPAPPYAGGIVIPATSPTPARSLPGRRPRVAPARPSAHLVLTEPLPAKVDPRWTGPSSARAFSTSRRRRNPALDSHEPSARPPPFRNSQQSPTYGGSPAARWSRTERPAPSKENPSRPESTPEKVDAGPTSPHPEQPADVAAATMPGPSSSAQRAPRPPSPYGEINDLARHPLLYDPVLAPRLPIILCHGERYKIYTSQLRL